MEDIESLEETIERNSEIKIETFQSAYEREKRDIFQKQMLPIVKHLRLCATCWEQELQNEVKTMKDVFNSNENTILVQKHRNRILKNDVDRLLEQFREADILSVVNNEISQSGTSTVFDNLMVENNLLKEEIEKLKHANDMLSKNNDDVCTQFSKENLQLKGTLDLCQAKSIEMELKLQNNKISKSCKLCKNLEKKIADLKIEVLEWQ